MEFNHQLCLEDKDSWGDSWSDRGHGNWVDTWFYNGDTGWSGDDSSKDS